MGGLAVEGTNVALKEHGTTVEASCTLKGYAIHQLDHIHDGHYGNQRSWISSNPLAADGSSTTSKNRSSLRKLLGVVIEKPLSRSRGDRIPV